MVVLGPPAGVTGLYCYGGGKLGEAMNTTAPDQPQERQGPVSIWNMAFISLFFANMIFNMGLNMSNALMAVFADSLGAPATAVGTVVSAYALSAMMFRFVSAPVIDTYNRKYIVVFAALIMSLAFFGFSISNTVPSLIVFRLLQGCGMAFGNACCLTMVAEMLPKDKYGSGIGYYSLAQVIATAIGPSIGLWLSGWFGYHRMYTITAVIMLLAAVLASQIRLPYTRTKKLKITLNNIIAKEALLPSTTLFLMVTGSVATNAFLVIFARNQGVDAGIGLYYTVSALTMLVSRPLIGKLNEKYGPVVVSIPAIFSNVVAFFIISFSTTLFGFLLAAFVSSFGMGACQPAMQALSMKTVTNDRRGAASCTNFIGMDLGTLVGPVIAGAIVQSLGYTIMWRLMVFPFLIGIALVFIFRSHLTRIEEEFQARQ